MVTHGMSASSLAQTAAAHVWRRRGEQHSGQHVYCAVSVDGDLRLGSPQQGEMAVQAMRQAHAALGLLGHTCWLINEHDFHWTELHPELLLELADSGECIGLHDHLDTHHLENEPPDRLAEFLRLSWRRIRDFFQGCGRDIPLRAHRNGCCQQGENIYQAMSGLEYTILSDVRPGMRWYGRMVPVNQQIRHWACLEEGDPGSICTDNSQVPLSCAPWRHDAANWLDFNSRSGRFWHAPLTCAPWVDWERVQSAVDSPAERVFLVIDTHPYDLQDPETGDISAQRVEGYIQSLEWVRDACAAKFIRIDQIPELAEPQSVDQQQE